MNLHKLGIIGSGKLASRLAAVALEGGLGVLIVDSNKERLENTVELIRLQLKENHFDEESRANEALLQKIQLALDLNALAGADWIIELITKREDLKVNLFEELEQILHETIPIITQVSNVSLTKLAGQIKNPARLVGLHAISSAEDVLQLELVRGIQTSDATMALASGLTHKMGLDWIVSHDFPGFVHDRLAVSLINEAIYTLFHGVAQAEDIDKCFAMGKTVKIGPLTLADTMGLDEVLKTLRTLHDVFGDFRYLPCPLLVKYVEAGRLGIKSGEGFFKYEKKETQAVLSQTRPLGNDSRL